MDERIFLREHSTCGNYKVLAIPAENGVSLPSPPHTFRIQNSLEQGPLENLAHSHFVVVVLMQRLERVRGGATTHQHGSASQS